jgi:DNA-directed RNA polymerase specialized sigma24 family protein
MARPEREGPDAFPTTNWANVRDAGASGGPGQRTALEELLRRYRPILWAHLVFKKRMPPDEADDLLQDFIQRKILQGNVLRLADPSKARFRTYLLKALNNFRIDCERKKAGTPPAQELHTDVAAEVGPDSDDVIWAMHVVVESLRRMRAECESKRRQDLWGIFAARFLGPLVGAEPVSYSLLVDQFGLRSGHQASIRYTTAKAMFRRNFRAVLVEDGGEEVEEQGRALGRVLCEASAELIEQLRLHFWDDVPEVMVSPSGESRIDLGGLARLLELPRQPADAAALLQQVLSAPVPLDLDAVDAALAEKARAWVEGQGRRGKSFGELLHDPNPPPELLELAKHVAKENRDDLERPLPRKVATVLYYACIAAALAHCGRRITSCDDPTLQQGFQWACDKPWVDQATRDLLREGLRVLGGKEGSRE